MNLFKKKKHWWEEDEEENQSPTNWSVRQELEKQFQNPIHDKSKMTNPFEGLDTSNMNLRQELEAKFKALRDNEKNYQTKLRNDLSLEEGGNIFEEVGNRRANEDKDPDFSYLDNTPLHTGLTAQVGQTPLKNLDTKLIQGRDIIEMPYSDNILENDCYQSKRFKPFAMQIRKNEGENQGIIYATPESSGIDQNTKYGISQDTLDRYRNKFKDLGKAYPEEVKDLTEEQAMNLICQFYKESRAEAINDANLAFAVTDSYFNLPQKSVNSWQEALRDKINPKIQIGGGPGSETINTFNQVAPKDKEELYELYLKYHLPKLRREYRRGIYNRTKRYH